MMKHKNKFERDNCISKIRTMRIFKTVFLLLVFTVTVISNANAQSEATKSGDLLYVKLGNGMNAVLMPIPAATNTEVSFFIKTGSIYEIDSLSGISNILQNILADKVARFLRNNRNSVSFQNTQFSSYTTTERTVFKLTTSSNNLGSCFNLLRDSVFNSAITASELMNAKQNIINEMELTAKDGKKNFENRLTQSIYRQDFEKLNVVGNAKEFDNISLPFLKFYFKKYYVPNNTLVTATGNFSYANLQEQLENSFKAMVKSEFNPETVTKVVDFKPMVYTTQFIVEDSTAAPEFHICWQFTGTASNDLASRCGYLLSAMLNDKNNFIQVKAAKMHCHKLVAQYEANNYNGVLRIVLQPDKSNWFNTYSFVVNELSRLEKTIVNESMLVGGKVQFKREYQALSKSKEYPQWIVKYWAGNDETYFPQLLDSLLSITETQMKSFVLFYMNQNPHVTGLLVSPQDRQELNVDSLFTNLNDSVGNYVFTYRQNITDLETKEDSTKLRNLLQWLKINSDVNIQINGFADEGEFNKVYDDSIKMFIDSIPTFKKAMPEAIKKGYLRPEMMRAMKLIKYFYDNGIEPERLSGTSMKFTSATREEAIANLKCTVSLEKMRKQISLYEFHYGKKKE